MVAAGVIALVVGAAGLAGERRSAGGREGRGVEPRLRGRRATVSLRLPEVGSAAVAPQAQRLLQQYRAAFEGREPPVPELGAAAQNAPLGGLVKLSVPVSDLATAVIEVQPDNSRAVTCVGGPQQAVARLVAPVAQPSGTKDGRR